MFWNKKNSIQVFIPASFENYVCHISTHWLKMKELNSVEYKCLEQQCNFYFLHL